MLLHSQSGPVGVNVGRYQDDALGMPKARRVLALWSTSGNALKSHRGAKAQLHEAVVEADRKAPALSLVQLWAPGQG
eukprot:15465654-Alexandrium_andersonii.AAC.1